MERSSATLVQLTT